MTTHLLRRGGRYYIRRRIPADLVEHYGKKERQLALGTGDPKEAATRVRKVGAELDDEFERARRELARTREVAPTPRPLEFPEDEWEQSALRAAYEGRYERLSEKQLRRSREMQDAVRRVLADRDPATPLGGLSQMPPASPFAALYPALARPAGPAHGHHTLDALVSAWAKARAPGQDTIDSASRMVARFQQLVDITTVESVTKLALVTFKDRMVEVGHSVQAAAKYVRVLSVLFNFAVSQAWIETNPAAGIVTRERKNAKVARPPFSEDALNGIFSNRVYTVGDRPETGGGEASFWLPLLGLYTGARIEELAQLAPSDIYEEVYRDEQGIERRCWVLRITGKGDGQEVKNFGSERRIPIHAELLKRGFAEYATSHMGQRRIFPKLKLDRYGRESPYWSMWWLRHIRAECGVTHPKMVFHSFRHNFKDACRECGIANGVADALQGHSEGTAAGNYGGEYYPLRPLVEAIEKYHVAGLKLPEAPLKEAA